jgi:uncharacterized SAM-dependent methyltransferase
MVLTALQTTFEVVPDGNCLPFVCDLATADDLPAVLDQLLVPRAPRLISFFGMIPNFEPQAILPRLASLMRRGDFLLFGANLAPDSDYVTGVRRILPLYDNAPTRDWLMTFLLDLGVEREDGEIRFVIEDVPPDGLKRIAMYFNFIRTRELYVDGEQFEFRSGDLIRLFFSYRHTPELVRTLLGRHGLEVLGQWVTKSQEEGVFLVKPR